MLRYGCVLGLAWQAGRVARTGTPHRNGGICTPTGPFLLDTP